MKIIRVLLLFGGESPEHEVSLASANNVYQAIDKEKYQVTLCYINLTGLWYEVESIRKAKRGDQMIFAVLGEKLFCTRAKKMEIDVILPILHGQNGEDGTVQGLAKLLHIPMAGPSLVSSVVAMDKDIAKKLLTFANLPVVDWVVIRKMDSIPTYENISKRLGNNLFIKPTSTGSSVGISKVNSSLEYNKAINLAFKFDEKIIVELAIFKAREIEVAVIGNKIPRATSPAEIIPGKEFYNYEDKYSDTSSALLKIPANLDSKNAEKIKAMALQAYNAIEGHGMARIDFFIDSEKKIYINEINTIPGFTNISMFPKLWQHEGLENSELIDRLLQLALEE